MEDNLDVKIVPMVVYNSMIDEIAKNTEKMRNDTSMKQYEDDLSAEIQILESEKAEYDKWELRGNDLLRLDKWCGTCKGAWGDCNGRVQYLMGKYGNTELKSKIDLMSEGSCLSS